DGGQRERPRETACWSPDRGERWRLEGQGLAKLRRRSRAPNALRDAHRVGHGDGVRISARRAIEVAALLLGVPPEGADHHALRAHGPGREAGMEDRQASLSVKLRHEKVVRRLEGEVTRALGL